MNAGAGADIHNMVGGADRFFVMFHDNDRIAEIAQALQGLEEAGVVALVETDGRLVQYIKNAGQTGADLRGKADALAFAAGEGAGFARQGEIVEADIVEEVQPVADFLQHPRGDVHFLLRKTSFQAPVNQAPRP